MMGSHSNLKKKKKQKLAYPPGYHADQTGPRAVTLGAILSIHRADQYISALEFTTLFWESL